MAVPMQALLVQQKAARVFFNDLVAAADVKSIEDILEIVQSNLKVLVRMDDSFGIEERVLVQMAGEQGIAIVDQFVKGVLPSANPKNLKSIDAVLSSFDALQRSDAFKCFSLHQQATTSRNLFIKLNCGGPAGLN